MEQQNHMSHLRQIQDHKHISPEIREPEPRPVAVPSDLTVGGRKRLDRPFKLPLYPPPSYAPTHDVSSLRLPVPPDAELAPIKFKRTKDDDKKSNGPLPPLSTLTASSAPPYASSTHPSEPTYASPAPPTPVNHWPSLNPFTAYYKPSHVQSDESPLHMDVDSPSTSAVGAASPERVQDGRASSVSLDDPDVRLAAEALSNLRADFVSSPSNVHSSLPGSPRSQSNGPHSEPLFSLLTTQYPFLAPTIEGATSAYNNSKNYSPRFKTSAEYVEGYVIPIANTVGSVGRVTGVEGGVRWFLKKGQRPKPPGSDLEANDQGSNKRRRVDTGSSSFRESSPEPGSGAQTPRASVDSPYDRRLSIASTVDTLPAYDDARSPPYAEHFVPNEPRAQNGPWQSRLIMSTSGLSIAMSEESLRSLKYCLSWLRWANVHISHLVASLKTTMENYENSNSEKADHDHPMRDAHHADEPMDRSQVAAKINALRSDVLNTLQGVINTVSKYAGGALPQNARELVRRHLTSLPQRFQVATMIGHEQNVTAQNEACVEEGQEAHERATRESARRVLVLAKEGLDMMTQVSGVLDGTIESAQEWCERLGKKKREQREALLGVSHLSPAPLDDVKTG